MRIAVISDSHDNVWKLEQAMPFISQGEVVIHCGDIIAPFTVRKLAEGVGEKPVHIVWGNNDGDLFLISKQAAMLPRLQLHGAMAELSLAGISVAVTHYPQIGKGLALSGMYGLVCYGHDHIAHEEWMGNCLLLNPGELMGLKGRSTMALVELPERKVEWVEL